MDRGSICIDLNSYCKDFQGWRTETLKAIAAAIPEHGQQCNAELVDSPWGEAIQVVDTTLQSTSRAVAPTLSEGKAVKYVWNFKMDREGYGCL